MPSDETTDERRSDKDREMGCGHGVRWTVPCTTCGRTESDIKLAAVLDDFRKDLWKHEQWGVANSLERILKEHFGKGGE